MEKLKSLLQKGFMTLVSESQRRYVRIEFINLEDAQDLHRRIIEFRGSENPFADESSVLSLIRDAGGEDLTVLDISNRLGFDVEIVKPIAEYLAQKGLIFQYNDGLKGDFYSSEFPDVLGVYAIGGGAKKII